MTLIKEADWEAALFYSFLMQFDRGTNNDQVTVLCHLSKKYMSVIWRRGQISPSTDLPLDEYAAEDENRNRKTNPPRIAPVSVDACLVTQMD
jgi:hypothetical protein